MSDITARFEAAMQALITDGPVKQRLVRAYTDNLEDLPEIEFPADAGDALAGLHRALHSVRPVGRETAVQASVQKMSPHEAAGHAGIILKLYKEIIATGRRSEHLKIVETGSNIEAQPPQFLVGGN